MVNIKLKWNVETSRNQINVETPRKFIIAELY